MLNINMKSTYLCAMITVTGIWKTGPFSIQPESNALI